MVTATEGPPSASNTVDDRPRLADHLDMRRLNGRIATIGAGATAYTMARQDQQDRTRRERNRRHPPELGMVTTEQPSFVQAIPALAVSNVARAVAFFADVLGFASVLVQADYGIARRDAVEVHFWAATGPEGSGAEPRLAGTTSCHLQVDGTAALYEQCQSRQVVHPNGALRIQPWGTREFTMVDPDGNAVTLFEGT